MNLENHATVRQLLRHGRAAESEPLLDGPWLRRLALDCGADDAGLVDIARPGLDAQREEILRNYPWTKSLLSLVVRMAREPVRGAPRSVANLEFHRAGDQVNEISAAIVARLEARGVRAVNPSIGFPMEMYQTPGHAIWVVSHKPVAVEAGLGHMGIHRNLIHPRYGNFVLLGTVLIDREATEYDHPIDYNPCLECKLCVGREATVGRSGLSAGKSARRLDPAPSAPPGRWSRLPSTEFACGNDAHEATVPIQNRYRSDEFLMRRSFPDTHRHALPRPGLFSPVLQTRAGPRTLQRVSFGRHLGVGLAGRGRRHPGARYVLLRHLYRGRIYRGRVACSDITLTIAPV